MSDSLRGPAKEHRAARVEAHRERKEFHRANGVRLRGLTAEDAAAAVSPDDAAYGYAPLHENLSPPKRKKPPKYGSLTDEQIQQHIAMAESEVRALSELRNKIGKHIKSLQGQLAKAKSDQAQANMRLAEYRNEKARRGGW